MGDAFTMGNEFVYRLRRAEVMAKKKKEFVSALEQCLTSVEKIEPKKLKDLEKVGISSAYTDDISAYTSSIKKGLEILVDAWNPENGSNTDLFVGIGAATGLTLASLNPLTGIAFFPAYLASGYYRKVSHKVKARRNKSKVENLSKNIYHLHNTSVKALSLLSQKSDEEVNTETENELVKCTLVLSNYKTAARKYKELTKTTKKEILENYSR